MRGFSRQDFPTAIPSVESGHLTAGQATEADALLPKLLLFINAIASSLRTTG